jgi:serine/threonine protein kinase
MYSVEEKPIEIGDFELVKHMKQGTYGAIWKASLSGSDDLYVVKDFDKQILVENGYVQKLMLQKEIMESCENEFIINLEYVFSTEQSLYFILPFISGGDLFSILKT